MSRRSRFNTPASLAALAVLAAASGVSAQGPGEVRTTILPGSPPPQPRPVPAVQTLPTGDVSLNFPGVDVQSVASAVFAGVLHVPFALDPNLHAQVTLVTPHPIRRADVVTVLEEALLRAQLVLVDHHGTYSILAAPNARAEAPTVGPEDPGYGNEPLRLKFVNADEMKKLIDPLVPGAIASTDATHNTLVISGGETQRKALRELVAEFDVDWLRGMSFALFVPQRTDARLIAPELEKLLNGQGAPTAGLVRLIAMDRLNGILAITAQPQYLEDTRRFVEILDHEADSAEAKVFVYRAQNSRASDLAKVLGAAFGVSAGGAGRGGGIEAPDLLDHTLPTAATASLPPGAAPVGSPGGPGGGSLRNGAPSGGGGDSGGGLQGRGGQGITITADETNNAIVVFATPRDYALIEDALAKLDVPPLQVIIDASISEVTLNHTLEYGLQWAFQAGRLGGAFSQAATQTNTTASGVTTNASGVPLGVTQNAPGLSFLYTGNGISATLNALSTVTDVSVLSAPKLMVLNNHTATIEVGDQVPVSTGSAQSTLSAGAPIVNSVEYRDTGVILKITPRVNAGGLVLLDIAQEVSSAGSTSSSSISSPTISQRKISTSVAVQDGETVALGGLIKNEIDRGRTSIPLLGNIPVLGHLFGETTGGLQRTELLVLLTPRVVRTSVDARAVTSELKAKIHLAAPPPPPEVSPKGKAKARIDGG